MTGDRCDNIALVLCPRSFSTPPAVTMLNHDDSDHTEDNNLSDEGMDCEKIVI